MGSERSLKEKKRSRGRSQDDSSSSDYEGRVVKRHRGTEKDDERASRRSEKKKKKEKEKKSHKSSSSKSKDDKHKKKHAEGDHKLKEGIPELSMEDYFSKNNEFATWLKEEKRTYFNDLTTEAARELFSRFVKRWNRGKLESRYYEGISTAPRTAHNWMIKRR
ncbi:PREDICTED: splicing regulatory glutamine/lysine-rich protein 1 isoform X2 [Camelina sativa]|uniref:Splicing regulatory glutamine/lysine-rich protein 1 isoform X1 n=1 Tax=Camelina sativa TaxID=90675 RepID=A0ABM0WLE9_CAMSA|nr:PREDICTED: splicing regulatory glutamine/lysine-rich protein 1 isoform X1 [Camelina sativa]XP_010472761.1 PREDICTED: splicing regulatory glutamine/lysine-rich protein 1 isoform X2 [Camelina sativa]